MAQCKIKIHLKKVNLPVKHGLNKAVVENKDLIKHGLNNRALHKLYLKILSKPKDVVVL